MKTSLQISRLTLLLGIAIWGNHAYASQCSSSSDPLVVSGSCEDLNISSSKSSVLIGSGVAVSSDVFGNQSAVTVGSGLSIPSFTNNGSINLGNSFYSGMVINSNTSIGVFTNNGSMAMSANNIGPSYYSALELYGKIDTLNNAGTIAATGIRSYGITMGGTASIGTLTNQTGQSIAGLASGILMGNGASITTLKNNGYITGTAASTVSPTSDGIVSNGLTLLSGATLGDLINAGSISGGKYGISNQGTITSLQNSGTISSSSDGSGSGISNNNGTITTLSNSGVITSLGRGITNSGASSTIGTFSNTGSVTGSYGIVNQFGTINSITNTGSINANGTTNSQAIYNIAGTIGNITNSGSINSIGIDSVGTTASYAIYNTGTISTITNTATVGTSTRGIFGASNVDINNTGTITTLNNAQNNLVLQGNLPTNYNIIINSPTSYGGLTYYSLGTPTQTNFGIDVARSNMPAGNGVFTNVLNGVSNTNLVKTSGSFTGGYVTTNWVLSSANNSAWNLNTTNVANSSSSATTSTSANNLNKDIAFAYNAIAANPSAPNPTLANGQTFTTNVLSVATAAQASQIGLQSNAEGYSSNRTIRLEQMNNVTNTVLDRIDSPSGKGTNTTNRVQLDDGRYLWGDIGGSRGNVNGYNNLASFGYNLVDVIIGGDLGRDSQKSYGVFGGIGYSDMTNSQTVVQSFNSTSYYLGGYGSYYLQDNLKLSGVGGYVYSANNSSRSLPTVAGFTGGNGSDSYGSNGIYAAAKVSKDYVINDSFTLVPFAGQSYAQFWTKGVTETGGGDFNVSIASATSYSTVSFAGLDMVMPLVKGVKDPLSLITFYKFGYDWFANSNSAHSVTATYTNLPLAPQTYVGANMGPISQQIGVGLQGAISKDISARIGAVASFNTHGQEYGGGAELRFKF